MQVTHPAGSRLQKMAEICTSHEGGGGGGMCVCVCVCVCVSAASGSGQGYTGGKSGARLV